MEPRSLQLLEFPKVLAALSNYSVSSAGKKACLNIFPLQDVDQINRMARRFRQVSSFFAETEFRLGGFTELDGLFAYLEKAGAVLDVDALFALVHTLKQASLVRDALSISAKRGWDELEALTEDISWPEKTFAGLKRCIDPDGNIKDESTPELYDLRISLRQLQQRCAKKVKDFIHGEDLSHYLQDEFMTISSDRYVLPLKSNFKGRFPGIIHDYSNTGETCYFEPMFLVELNNTLQELKQKEKEEEHKVLKYLTGLLRSEFDETLAAYNFLVEFDVLQSKNSFAQDTDGVVLDVEPESPIKLVGARHPLLAASGENAEPVNIELNQEQRILIISGGNAGGKTVTLKTAGLIAIMAYSGLPVSVEKNSTIPLYKSIFAIMGDEQSLEDHVSTFTAQIRSFSRIWPEIDSSTLFLMDEFGAGTDPTQGAALAQAVVDGLLGTGATCFAATHFPALKAYALATEHVRAASVLFDPATKKPLFRLAYDQVGASIAIDVAREHGLPSSILSKAEQYLLLDGSDTSGVMDRLNSLAVEREKELDNMKIELEKLKIKRSRLEEKFRREKVAILDEVKAASQSVLKQWQDGRIGRKQALKKMAQLRESISDNTDNEKQVKPFSFEEVVEGSEVMNLGWNRKGTVLEKDDRRNRVKIDMDGVAMWIPASQVGPVESDNSKPVPGNLNIKQKKESAPRGDMTLKVDLRGMRADIAISELEKFFDQALLRGATNLEIIHGRGTGALRREVHSFLKDNSSVSGYSLAPEDQGGDGMTQVELY
ncbi:endonuclease MutS2 [Maridesulfovibrio bastinii]|uniref:endonuclease MutS2 n=1 Tax=Maridesulfovibrio bastinii TaxID=47157 RepID=UPI000418BBD2|nr:endonuclease MutS2 [Maridesulfovibrio bastinii]